MRQNKGPESLWRLGYFMTTLATAVVYSVRLVKRSKKKKRLREEPPLARTYTHTIKTACFCCQTVDGCSFMTFEASDVVAVFFL